MSASRLEESGVLIRAGFLDHVPTIPVVPVGDLAGSSDACKTLGPQWLPLFGTVALPRASSCKRSCLRRVGAVRQQLAGSGSEFRISLGLNGKL